MPPSKKGHSRVTAGEVAIATGLDVWQVERDLMSLAVDAGGHLQVDPDGNLAYLFPRNLKAILLGRDCWALVKILVGKAAAAVMYLVRISFGLFLIGLILATVAALAVVVIVRILKSESSQDGFDVSSLFVASDFECFSVLVSSPSIPATIVLSENPNKRQGLPEPHSLFWKPSFLFCLVTAIPMPI